MNKLEEICARKKEHVKSRKEQKPLTALLETIGSMRDTPRGFKTKLRKSEDKGEIALIAEVKKASPSKGIIREDFDPSAIARIYESAGASCLSVLTDTPYFQGKDQYLQDIRGAVALPLLRKDFMIDPYQIYESRVLGADCILLILAALTDPLAREMYDVALELGMDVLVETHGKKEVERAQHLPEAILGVNSRNLKTLEVDLQTALNLAAIIPHHRLKIAESGIAGHEDVIRLKQAGYQGFLIGESLMRASDIGQATRKILGHA